MKNSSILVLVALLLSSPWVRAAEEIRVGISTTAEENVFSKIRKPFQDATGIKIRNTADRDKTDSVSYLMVMLEGGADAATSANPIVEIIKLAKDRGLSHPDMPKVTQRLIGRDLMHVFVNQENGVSSLTANQISDLFTGKIKNWKEVGGADLPVKVAIQDKKGATTNSFRKLVMKGQDFSAERINVGNHDDVLNYLGKNKGGIGMGAAEAAPGNVIVVKTEPIGRAIFLYTIGRPSANVQKLLDFIQSEGPKHGVGK